MKTPRTLPVGPFGYSEVMRSLRDRVVLVTGGSAGIGRATARRLARHGARVVICGRDGERLGAALAEMPGVLGLRCDVTVAADRERLVEFVVEHCGRIDALVNNAGQARVGKLVDLTGEQVEGLVAVNFTAVAELTRLVLARLPAVGDVVMISSFAGWVPVPPLSLYSATKAGVSGLVTALRREVPRGVRVHVVCPGPARTEWLVRDVRGRPTERDAPRRTSAGTPADRVAAEVERCLTARWSRTVAVPRWLGLARPLAWAPVSRVVDVLVAPVSSTVVRLTRKYGKRL